MSTVSWVFVLVEIRRCWPAPVPERMVTVEPTHLYAPQLFVESVIVVAERTDTVPESNGGATIL